MKVIYSEHNPYDSDDYSDVNIKMNDVRDLDHSQLCNLLSETLLALTTHKNETKRATDIVKQYLAVLTPEEVKTTQALKVKGPKLYFLERLYGGIEVDANEKISEYNLKGIVSLIPHLKPDEFPSAFAQVEIPLKIRRQIKAYREKLEKEKQIKLAKKEERAIAKAKKLLTKHKEVA